MTVRDERAAVLRRWHRDMGDNFTAVLPRVLDDLDAIDRAQVPGPIKPARKLTHAEADELARQWTANSEGGQPPAPTDEQVAAWVEAHPQEFADWAARQAKTSPAPVSGQPPKAPPATRTATRRRRTT